MAKAPRLRLSPILVPAMGKLVAPAPLFVLTSIAIPQLAALIPAAHRQGPQVL